MKQSIKIDAAYMASYEATCKAEGWDKYPPNNDMMGEPAGPVDMARFKAAMDEFNELFQF